MIVLPDSSTNGFSTAFSAANVMGNPPGKVTLDAIFFLDVVLLSSISNSTLKSGTKKQILQKMIQNKICTFQKINIASNLHFFDEILLQYDDYLSCETF